MPKVLILSDSHGLTAEITKIKERHQLKHMIHCGDSELEMDAAELDNFYKVGGNCDLDPKYPSEQVFTLEGVRFFIVHGHLHQVKTGLLPLSYRAKEEKADVVCFGHTHIAGVENVENQLFINPGSISMPRSRREKTYAILEWEEGNKTSVTFYTTDGEEVAELSYHADL
ncbi:metallophosphoesterase [Virgibacillus sp. YIM 98842]|jgi:hypothetical protein|uniref:metallophosphoesterase n=1 Tax=Virgibacillus sp. YIM 98842 TaxID=2663533 RepID=UPI0013DBC00B|nr:metallophosphoesterase [Virgibacillus sp. YIM 98842]